MGISVASDRDYKNLYEVCFDGITISKATQRSFIDFPRFLKL